MNAGDIVRYQRYWGAARPTYRVEKVLTNGLLLLRKCSGGRVSRALPGDLELLTVTTGDRWRVAHSNGCAGTWVCPCAECVAHRRRVAAS